MASRGARLSESSSESEEPPPPPPKPKQPSKKGKSESKSSKSKVTYAEELEKRFASRYTLEDPEYAETLKSVPPSIPIVPEYQGRNYRGGYRGGGGRGGGSRRFNDR